MIHWNHVLEFTKSGNPPADRRVEKTPDEWRAQLTPEQFRITREHGTERAFSSEMCEAIEPGQYACVCCDTLLFDADEKFDSGTGWPSFTQPAEENAVAYAADNRLARSRIEVTCNACDAHLGHVFPDGPEPSGLRFCINAEALRRLAGDEG